MEKLIIHNFLTIRSAEIDVRRFNIFIGPQASGKSIFVKLLYFFKAELGKAFQETVSKKQGKAELELALKSKFEIIFPRTYWNTQEFCIEYRCSELTLMVKTQKEDIGGVVWSITCSNGLYELQFECIEYYKYLLKQYTNKILQPKRMEDWSIFAEAYRDVEKSIYDINLQDGIFIPANRTFITSLQGNIFSFLSEKISIDYFLKEFGSTYELAKRLFSISHIREYPSKYILLNEPIKIMEKIISGHYLDEHEEDWIVNVNGKISLAHASSGQQESLPMLLVLCELANNEDSRASFFIEEPEAHIYPDSQKAIISLLALILNKTKNQLFITTHSPYLLTALNNCILAHETYAFADEAGRQKVLDIMPEHQHIAFEDVAAWTVTEKGTIKSILDQDAKIIGASILDSVSQHFETVTNELLDIRFDAP